MVVILDTTVVFLVCAMKGSEPSERMRASERRYSVVVVGENKQCILHVLMAQCRLVIKSLVRL
jgi:hypothetical protein